MNTRTHAMMNHDSLKKIIADKINDIKLISVEQF